MSPIQKMNNIAQHGQNATRQVTEAVLDGQEKLIRSNLDALEEVMRQNTQQFKDACASLKQANALDNWPRAIMENIQRSTAINLGYVEIARNLQQDIAFTMEESLRALRDGSMDAVDQFSDAGKLFPTEMFRAFSHGREQHAA